jgi:hypothetical protein
MKALWICSLICLFTSLLALPLLSAMTVAPPGSNLVLVLFAALLAVLWIRLAVFARRRMRAGNPAIHPWIQRTFIVFTILYMMTFILFVIG